MGINWNKRGLAVYRVGNHYGDNEVLEQVAQRDYVVSTRGSFKDSTA